MDLYAIRLGKDSTRLIERVLQCSSFVICLDVCHAQSTGLRLFPNFLQNNDEIRTSLRLTLSTSRVSAARGTFKHDSIRLLPSSKARPRLSNGVCWNDGRNIVILHPLWSRGTPSHYFQHTHEMISTTYSGGQFWPRFALSLLSGRVKRCFFLSCVLVQSFLSGNLAALLAVDTG